MDNQFGNMNNTLDNQSLGRAIGQGIADGMNQYSLTSQRGKGPLDNSNEGNEETSNRYGLSLNPNKMAMAGTPYNSLTDYIKTRMKDIPDAIDAYNKNYVDPNINTYHGMYNGTGNITSYLNGDYNFQLMVNLPKYQDMVYLDVFITMFGMTVSEQTIPNIYTESSHGKFYFMQTDQTTIVGNVARANEQLEAMMQRGTRWWKEDKEIGVLPATMITSPTSAFGAP